MDAGPPEPPAGSSALDDFLDTLPPADHPKPIDMLVSKDQKRVDDPAGPFDCSSEVRHVEDVIEELPQLTAANSNILPGLAFGSRTVADGTMNLLPVARGGLAYVIALAVGDPQFDVPQVTLGSAQNAVSTLQRRAGDMLAPAMFSHDSEIVSSLEQAVHSFGVGIKAKALLEGAGFGLLQSTTQSNSRRAIVARLVQPLYTISVSDDRVARPSQFFARSVTVDQLRDDGEIGPDNLPTFIKSVTYGRVLYIAIVTEEATSSEELSVALNASFKGFEGNLEIKDTYMRIVGKAVNRVLALGGSQTDALEALQKGDYSLFFKPVKAVDAVPIAYKMQYMHRDRQTVAIRSALDYTMRDCTRCLLEPAWTTKLHAEAEKSCGFPGGSADYHIGSACDPGWQRDRIEILKVSGDANCGGGSWEGDDITNCSGHLHVGCSWFQSVTCKIRIHSKQLTPGQPPLCKYAPP